MSRPLYFAYLGMAAKCPRKVRKMHSEMMMWVLKVLVGLASG
jgi:hypothetical protein